MTWPSPPSHWSLAPAQVHVWAVSLMGADTRVAQLERILSPAEQERAARFHFASDRQAYIVAHGVLREVLQNYLQAPAANLVFETGSHGKPHLSEATPAIQFNLAHTRGLALIALCRQQEVGVDVEWRGRPAKVHEIAQRYFTPNEQTELSALPEGDRTAGFFHAWTRKEAILKACGRGLSVAPTQIEVSLSPGRPAQVFNSPADITPATGWLLWDLQPAPEYSGALALPGGPWGLSTWTYPAGGINEMR